jgi:putative copper export protein
MAYHHLLLIFHLLAATIWLGGHLFLVALFLPKALRNNEASVILDFQAQYERIGMLSLYVLIGSGVAMALDLGIYPNQWFHFSGPIEKAVSIKILLLALTLGFALSARFFVIPRMKSGANMLGMIAIHIISVTTIAVLMLIVGSSIRFGGL